MFPVKYLHTRLRKLDRPLAVVIGSALSITRGDLNLGVPDVTAMLDRIRQRMVVEGVVDDYDEALREASGNRYQEAFAFVQSNLGARVVDEIVRDAVLEARVPGAPDLGDDEGRPEHWHLPKGTAALGRLLAEGDPRFSGPVLTTNFDPLLSMAVEVAGGRVDRRVLTRDGHLPDPGDSRHGPRIVHLHGFWRGSTLHLPHHLTAPRPKLLGSLRELLAGHSVLVAAYGGWQDAFMQALGEVINQPETNVEIIWCLYGDEGSARHNNRQLLERLEGDPRFTPYYGVDAHQLFEQLSPAASSPSSSPTPPGKGTQRSAPLTALSFSDYDVELYLTRLETEHATVPLIG
ncbi:MAG: SIR2 family protein, partial [Myxococcales bacterium]|nr:SIR2 family protein [Myxococcales bacterium]